jgi:hypothetical protein
MLEPRGRCAGAAKLGRKVAQTFVSAFPQDDTRPKVSEDEGHLLERQPPIDRAKDGSDARCRHK